jgi:glycerate 2-kinase
LSGEAATALRAHESYVVCAVGKAATGMLAGFEAAAPGPVRARVSAVGPHPTPTDESCRTARRALELAARIHDRECLVLLVSGGASAMLALPAGGLSLDDKIGTVRLMLAGGVPIEGMNAVRKHLSAVKGGWLASRARACCTLAISDVIGAAEDDLSVIGSGPGVADRSTFGEAVRVLRDGGLWDRVPAAVREHLARGEAGDIPETPKPGDVRLAHASGLVIGSRRDAMSGARGAAARLGYRTVVVDEPILGEAKLAGPAVIERARRMGGDDERLCVISSGETTVRVTGAGRGGRNQELALAALPALAAADRPMTLVSLGTDGVDGPTDAAGAIADRASLARASALGLPAVDRVLAANDAYPFFDALGDLLRTGPTGTNVGDLQIVLVNA